MLQLPRFLLLSVLLLAVPFIAAPAVVADEGRADEGQADEGRADEATPEDRFHEAYVLEVIEGKAKDAAPIYLALMGDADAPADVRAEARLRFAICIILLGRPDEARLQLADLIRDAATPAATRTRAEAMLQSVSGLEAGSELDKKLQSLVFELARAKPEKTPPQYRDFEVIGERALPFLRRLLHHRDPGLVRHAFRLLARMDEPGLGAVWTPAIGVPDSWFSADWALYLWRHPVDMQVWEAKLVPLDDEKLASWLLWPSKGPRPPFSLAFLEGLAKRPPLDAYAFRVLAGAGDPTARWALLDRWLGGDDEELAQGAAAWILRNSDGGPDDAVALKRWTHVLRHATPHDWRGARQLDAYLLRLPTSALLDALETFAVGGVPPKGLVATLSEAIGARDLDASSKTRWGELLRRWVVATEPSKDLLRALRQYLEVADEVEAKAFVTFLFQGAAKGRVDDWQGLFEAGTPKGVGLLLQALEVAARDDCRVLADRLPDFSSNALSLDVRRRVLDALPALSHRLHTTAALPRLLHWIPRATRDMPVEERQRIQRALIDVGLEEDVGFWRLAKFPWTALGTGGADAWPAQANYFADTATVVLDERWQDLSAGTRQEALNVAWKLTAAVYANGYGQVVMWADLLTAENRERVQSFLRRHLDETPENQWRNLAEPPEIAPLEVWVPLAPEALFRNRALVSTDEGDLATARLEKELTEGNAAVLAFVRTNASEGVKTQVFDRMLRSDDAKLRRWAIRQGKPASIEALEEAGRALLAEEAPDLMDVRAFVGRLLQDRPSADLFPFLRLLLKSDVSHAVQSGIRYAKSLGQEALVPDLLPLLGSMDEVLRNAARDAIASIREVTRMKEEAAAVTSGK